jgi:hypothetical protein
VVVGKPAFQKVAIEENMKKGPIYEAFRQDPHVQDIFTATDKDLHKQRVCRPIDSSRCFVLIRSRDECFPLDSRSAI